MQLDKKQVIDNAQKYAELIKRHINPEKIVLYGSYARGNWHKDSDIDIAVIVDNISDDFLSISTMLNKLTRNIDYRIEPVLLEKDDDRSGFLTAILLYGRILYEKNSETKNYTKPNSVLNATCSVEWNKNKNQQN